jgi:hypothetical protein
MKLSRLLMCFVILALVGCAQGVIPQGQAPYPPYSPENNGNMRTLSGPLTVAENVQMALISFHRFKRRCRLLRGAIEQTL